MILDIVIAILLAIAFGYGWTKGLLRSLLAAVAVLVALVAAAKLSAVASFWLRDRMEINSSWLPLASLLIVFIGVLLLFTLAGRFLESILDAIALGFLNRMAGGLVFSLLAALVLSTLLWYADNMKLVPDINRKGSVLYPAMLSAGPEVQEQAGKLVPAVKDSYERLELFFEEVAENAPLPDQHDGQNFSAGQHQGNPIPDNE